MAYQRRCLETMLRYELLHIAGHCRIVVGRVVRRVAMIPQILGESATEIPLRGPGPKTDKRVHWCFQVSC